MTDPAVREEIMAATYEALCEHGYTDLTAQAIADRTAKSKSWLFYHYDSKDDLVADFLGYLLERFEQRLAEVGDRPPAVRLATFVDWYLHEPADDREAVHIALLELRAQAPYDDKFREQLCESDDRLRATLESILEDGIAAGQFRDHDTAEVAKLLLTTLDGARVRQLTLGRSTYLTDLKETMIERVIDDILEDDVDFPVVEEGIGTLEGTHD